MSRTQRQGIEYFPFAVDFFSDKKTKILKARYGSDGLAIYVYILCTIYREGYYTKIDNDFKFIISDELNIRSETVEQVITYLLDRSMFDKQVFQSAEVLTSHGIQERWQCAVKARAAKTPIKVEKYWLLSEEETLPFIKVTHFSDSSEKKENSSEKKDDNSENYPQSKVKYSKVKDPPIIPLKEKGEEEETKSDEEKFYAAYPKFRSTRKKAEGEKIDYALLLRELPNCKKWVDSVYSMKVIVLCYDQIVAGEKRDKSTPLEDSDARAERERWYARRREIAQAQAERFVKRAQADPEYVRVDAELTQVVRETAKAEAFSLPSLAALKKSLEELEKKRISILTDIGITEEDLFPKYACTKCSDTGFLPDGRSCDCYKKEKN